MSRSRGGVDALILVAHGSKAKGLEPAFRRVGAALARERAAGRVVCAYLEINRPSIAEAVDRAVEKGARRIVIMPYFLLIGRHTSEDIPRIAGDCRRRHPNASIRLAPYLGFDKSLVRLVKKRVRSAA